MTRTKEFQEEYSEIERERGAVHQQETIISLRILVVKMLREMSSLEETVYLLSSPENAKHLHKSIEQAKSKSSTIKE